MTVTIKDIAKVAGVSHTTVSRALHSSPEISVKTASRIRQIAAQLGYVPNSVARGLKTNRSRVLGVIVRRIVDPYISELLQGIEEVLRAEGYSLFLAASQRDPELEKKIAQAMSERRVDGAIICSTEVSEEHRRQLERFGVPTVLINNQAADDGTYSVYHDDIFGSQEMTRHLIALGHRRIAYLGNAHAGRLTAFRLQGYTQAMSAAGLPVLPELVVEAPNGLPQGGAIGAQSLLELAEPPTAIFCYNDMIAIGAIQALQGAGLRIPSDCSVAGFDNIDLAAYVTPPLTTFDQPKLELGRQAAQMMLRLLAKGGQAEAASDTDPNVVVLRGKICVRRSTAPPPN